MIDFYCDNCEFLQDKSNDNIIDGYCKKYNQSLTFYDWFEKCDKCLIETLQSENASLRARLGKFDDLHIHMGEKVYIIADDNEIIERFICGDISFQRKLFLLQLHKKTISHVTKKE